MSRPLLDRLLMPSSGPAIQRRLRRLVAAILLVFLVLASRLWQLQVMQGDRYLQRATDNVVKEHWIPAVRGRIFDRHGVVLVDNRPSFNVFAMPKSLRPEVLERVVRLLGLMRGEAEDLAASVDRARTRTPGQPLLLFEDVSRDQVALIEQARAELPGVVIEDLPHRNYVSGTLAAHVLGYMNQISDSELAEKKDAGYEAGDYVGRYGIEKQWENYLRGKKGIERYVVNVTGKRLPDDEAAELIRDERFVAPFPGHDLVLTLDVELQRLAERALRNHPAGGIAVVEVETGKILALVSKPAFDPNVMTGHLTRTEAAAMEADPYKPFLDKTLRQHYYPGSTFKFVVAAAALEDEDVDPDERVTCQGSLDIAKQHFHCGKAHGRVSIYEAMAQSCNVYFWHLAQKVGIDRIAEVATDFGFGAATGLGLNGDVPGHVPVRSDYMVKGGFRIGYTLNTAIGQGDTEVTVLQLALAYAAIANGGRLFVPQLVERVVTPTGEVVTEVAPRVRRKLAISDRALALIRHGLWGVVNDPNGTAFAARIGGVSAAGKTGTAQVRKLTKQRKSGYDPYRDHAWFAGYAPAENPKIALVVLVEHGGKGGQVAAPVAMEIAKGYLDNASAPRAAATDDKGKVP